VALDALDKNGLSIDNADIQKLSPLGSKHINLRYTSF
jgi:hypothetical protein